MEQPVIPGFVQDINDLLTIFVVQDKDTYTFASFKQTWISRSFSFIHRGSAPNIPPDQYPQALFRVSLYIIKTIGKRKNNLIN